MTITLLKKMKRGEQGLCIKCGHAPCDCKTSQYLPKRKGGKRGKRRFGRNDAGLLKSRAAFFIKDF